MDAATYFFVNSTLVIVVLGLVFALLGLWLGWIFWGECCSKITEVDETKQFLSAAEAKLITARNEVSTAEAKIETAESARAEAEARAAAAEKALAEALEKADKPTTTDSAESNVPDKWSAFAGDIDSGKARIDDTLGVIYSTAPDNADDLTAIKGIAKVLNGKLNNIGVYTYRQIACWDDVAIEEFAKLLSFKDRVKRDDWVSQCKAFHKEKYDEDL